MKRMNRPARMLRIEGLMMRRKGALETTGVVGLMILPKDLASTGVRKVTLSDMMNCEGWTFWEPGDRAMRMIELFDVVDCRWKVDILE